MHRKHIKKLKNEKRKSAASCEDYSDINNHQYLFFFFFLISLFSFSAFCNSFSCLYLHVVWLQVIKMYRYWVLVSSVIYSLTKTKKQKRYSPLLLCHIQSGSSLHHCVVKRLKCFCPLRASGALIKHGPYSWKI